MSKCNSYTYSNTNSK